MEIGIDSFASTNSQSTVTTPTPPDQAMAELLERIQLADQVGLDVFGIGEHHREEFLDAAPSVILAAAASTTHSIKLTSAVCVLSAADPVRIFQQFATLDLISKGRAEIVIGRGSFSEAFPLFGLNFEDYDNLFDEKAKLLLQIRDQNPITWSGQFRPPLNNQLIYPRPIQDSLPIWIGIGGSPESCIRAGSLGTPLMIAIIGGQTHRFRYHVDIYKQAGEKAGHNPNDLKVGIHSIGYVSDTNERAQEEFFPGYQEVFSKIGQERGWSPITRAHFDQQINDTGAFLVGDPDTVAQKMVRHSQALGGLSRITFQMNVAALSHEQLLNSIRLIGEEVVPRVKKLLSN